MFLSRGAAKTSQRRVSKEQTRRIPTQARSRERVLRILDAAAHEFAELGFEAATTEGIAVRAGTSVGSIYQFFPNKHALFEAIGSLYLDEVRTLFETMTTKDALKVPWWELLDGGIDAFAALHKHSVGFRAVWLNIQLSRGFLEAGEALNAEIAKRIEAIFAHQATGLGKAQRKLVANMVVETISAMLLFAARSKEPFASQIMEETKVLVRRYVEPYLGPPASPATKKPSRASKRDR